eukprot:TRINITY_DN955_c1_g1_i1.p1 TRINITY_DN955_c1_g1~~TRINITY_DN955_c1_g1_i1.p1  ORF type:complete len:334 (-),score=-75.12 TRINITY_DN955_c1_g1_i1:307-1308(-)
MLGWMRWTATGGQANPGAQTLRRAIAAKLQSVDFTGLMKLATSPVSTLVLDYVHDYNKRAIRSREVSAYNKMVADAVNGVYEVDNKFFKSLAKDDAPMKWQQALSDPRFVSLQDPESEKAKPYRLDFSVYQKEASKLSNLPKNPRTRNKKAPRCNRIITGEDVDILMEYLLGKEDAVLRDTYNRQAIQNVCSFPPDIINGIGSYVAQEMDSQDYFIWAAECWYIANITGMSFRVLAVDTVYEQKYASFHSPSPDCDHLRLDPAIFQRAGLDQVSDIIANSATDPQTRQRFTSQVITIRLVITMRLYEDGRTEAAEKETEVGNVAREVRKVRRE